MDKKVFQSGTAITPEFINELQNLSFSKAANEVGHLPNPDDTFHLQQWKTFTANAENRVNLGDWNKNVILIPSAKDQSITMDHYPQGMVIYTPDWDSESISTAVTIGNSFGATPIIKGGIGIFFSDGNNLVGRSLIGTSDISLAQLKELIAKTVGIKDVLRFYVGKTSNLAFNFIAELREGTASTYDLIITKPGDSRKIKILGDTFEFVLMGLYPQNIDFHDGLKNFWSEIDGEDGKLLRADRIDTQKLSTKRFISKDIDITGSGDSSSNSQTQYETALGYSTSFYYLGTGAAMFKLDKTTCEKGERIIIFSNTAVYIRSGYLGAGQDPLNNDYTYTRFFSGVIQAIEFIYLGLNSAGNALWVPIGDLTATP